MVKTVESKARKVRLRTNIQHVLLHTVATAGFLSIALLAPNALRVLSMFDGGKGRKQNPRYLFDGAFNRLLSKGMIVIETTPKGKHVCLTERGKNELARMIAHSPDRRTHRRWDKRWRIVTYDIKEERKALRMKLAELLRVFGFYRLQNSLWVYPYDSEALLILLKANYKIGSEVLYGVMEQIENDKKIKVHFGLK